MLETSLGKRVRCIACAHAFVADLDVPAPRAQPQRWSLPPREDAPPPPPPPPPERGDREGPPQGPLCPRCRNRVGWVASACPKCGIELEPDLELFRRDGGRGREGHRWAHRRDGEPHRGPLIANLGNACLIAACLSLCLFGLGAVVSVPTGVAAWVMANRDLALMRSGLMDPQGRAQTENGRTSAVIGLILSVCFAGMFALLCFGH